MDIFSLHRRWQYVSFFQKLFLVVSLLSGVFALVSESFALTIQKEATYYADAFEGRKTANGDIFSQKWFSASICDIPLGQYLYVSKWGTGIVVDANDRPNCSRYPNIIDLSREAYSLFAPLSSGRISDISVTPLGPSPTQKLKGFLPRDIFSHLGVMLDSSVPTVLFAGQGITIRGKVIDPSDYVIVYLSHENGEKIESRLVKVEKNKTFQIQLLLPKLTGEYTFIIARGKSFDTNIYTSIFLIDEWSLSYPSLPLFRSRLTPKFSFADSTISVALPENMSSELTIRQGDTIFETAGTALVFEETGLSPGRAQVQMKGYKLSTVSPLDRSGRISSLFSGSVLLDRSHEVVGKEKVYTRILKNNANLRFIVPDDVKVRSKFYLILPDGNVEEKIFDSRYIGQDSYLIPGSVIQLRIPLTQEGTYIFEAVRQDGIAYVNIPLTRGIVWSILKPLPDEDIRLIRRNKDTVIRSVLAEINTLRTSVNIPKVTLDPVLTTLAQAKVDDMIRRGYQAHQDPDGLFIDGLAKKLNLSLGSVLWENIGYGNVSDRALQDGLEVSGSHRYTMLRANFTKVGIGYGIKEDKVYLVHVFGN